MGISLLGIRCGRWEFQPLSYGRARNGWGSNGWWSVLTMSLPILSNNISQPSVQLTVCELEAMAMASSLIYPLILVGGFWPPLWKMMDFVNWDDDIPNINGKIKNGNQTTNQKFMSKIWVNLQRVWLENWSKGVWKSRWRRWRRPMMSQITLPPFFLDQKFKKHHILQHTWRIIQRLGSSWWGELVSLRSGWGYPIDQWVITDNYKPS